MPAAVLCPAAHAVQLLEPAAPPVLCPASQSMHSVAPVAPSVLWPGSQAEHSVGPPLDQKLAAEYLPASQAEQLLAPLPEYRPSAQALHSRHPVPRKLHSPARK